jgi:serine/threonine-protein kinase
MEVYCTRPGCPRPVNQFADLDDNATLKTVQQKFCTTCGMPLILVGRYIPQKLLGRGGFGAAFLARDRYTPAMRQCVVKQFQPAGDLSPDQLTIAQELFEREGEVLEVLGNKHPQIPDLLAFFQLDVPSRLPGKPDRFFYLVQEFIDGRNMEEELAAKGKFSESEVLEVLTEILNVLEYVHDNGSIHRDIKPSNIMRHRNGRLYLLDFGAVKQVTRSVAAAGRSGRASTGIYSMGFAPPEQMAGDIVYPATDLYALGVTCIMLLTGKEPGELYDSYSNRWSWRSHAQVSDRLADVLDRMLLPSPNQRFQSAEEVLVVLAAPPPPPPAPPPAPAPAPIPTPSPRITPVPVAAPPVATASFSTLELLAGAAFTGFEAGVLSIALMRWLPDLAGLGLALLLVTGLVFVQSRRILEKQDLLIIAGLTVAAVFFVLRASFAETIIVSCFAGLLAVAVTIVFRLIYKLLSRVV